MVYRVQHRNKPYRARPAEVFRVQHDRNLTPHRLATGCRNTYTIAGCASEQSERNTQGTMPVTDSVNSNSLGGANIRGHTIQRQNGRQAIATD